MQRGIRDEDIAVTPAMIDAGETVYCQRGQYFDDFFDEPTPMIIALYRAMVRAGLDEQARQSSGATGPATGAGGMGGMGGG